MYRVIRVVAFLGIKRHRMAVRANTGQSPNSVAILGQRRIRLTGIEQARGCVAGIGWVGLHCVAWMLASIGDGGGRNRPTRCVVDILVSLFLLIIIFWTYRIPAHEENQYSYVYKILGQFLSKALKQTKTGPRSSGTPFPVTFISEKIYFNNISMWDYVTLSNQIWRTQNTDL